MNSSILPNLESYYAKHAKIMASTRVLLFAFDRPQTPTSKYYRKTSSNFNAEILNKIKIRENWF